MKQFQYLLRNLDDSEHISETLKEIGVESDHIHFLSRDTQGLAEHDVDGASLFEERDILHSGMQGAMWGFAVAVLVSTAAYVIQPLNWQLSVINVIMLVMLFTGFGSWLGGLVGLNHDNYKIGPYHQHLREGKAILLIYFYPEKGDTVAAAMNSHFPQAKLLAKHSSLDNPLVLAKLVEYD